MNSEHGVDVDGLIQENNRLWEVLRTADHLTTSEMALDLVRLKERNIDLQKRIEQLQCCGNCKHFMHCKTDGLVYCDIEVYPFPVKGICDKWTFDEIKERSK